MPATLTLQEIYLRVAPQLRDVEEEFRQQIDSDIEVIRKASRYVIESGGKRIRPALLLLTTRLFNYSGHLATVFASIVELIHTATLIHDDIVDEADTRRGQQSMNRRWGNEITVLLGDYLYIKSMARALDQNNLRLLNILSRATLRMVEGEIAQLTRNGRLDVTADEHLDLVSRKTAGLFSACCEIGAVVAGAREEEIEALRDYGMDLGMAFQIIDDVLDFTSTQSTLGKPVVNDLKEGRLTLPLIYLLRKDDGESRAMIGTVLRERGFVTISKERILAALAEHRTIDETLDLARAFGHSAQKRLAIFPDSEIKEALFSLPTFIIERDR
ncbi:MAG: polyprenyl synthetase family protein [Acidobacteria bacterium]|nr:polyprenyl synthetase family protein [Acidobacteriota bacterium]